MDYNGWKNRETWLVNLWLDDCIADMQEAGCEITPEFIEELVCDMVNEELGNGLIYDLLSCALGEIDYHEIAEHYKELADDDNEVPLWDDA